MYYRGEIDVSVFEGLDWPGKVFRPFEWGQVMYGGAVFDLDGRHFDIHYRNLDVVEHWTREAERGRFEVHILGFHLAGIPTYMLVGELATNRVLAGELPRPAFPEALRMSAPAIGWNGLPASSPMPGTGRARQTRSAVRAGWLGRRCSALTLGSRTDASGR